MKQLTSSGANHYASPFGVRWLDNAFILGVLGRSRSESAVKPAQSKARQNEARFAESFAARFSAHWQHEPTPGPSREGSFVAGGGEQFPSWEGCRGGFAGMSHGLCVRL